MPGRNSIIIGLAVALVAVGAYFAITYSSTSNDVPVLFAEARSSAGRAAQEITDLSKQVRDDLNKVQELQRKGNIKEARAALADIQSRNETIKRDASQLSTDLTTMAQSIADIGDGDAQPLALEAVTIHVEIMKYVVTYNEDLEELTGLLETRFQGKAVQQKRIDELVKRINDAVDTINGLNTQATEKLRSFDDAIRASN